MTMQQFINENRKDIDACIFRAYDAGSVPSDDSEREAWGVNDESLYNWAESEGVEL